MELDKILVALFSLGSMLFTYWFFLDEKRRCGFSDRCS